MPTFYTSYLFYGTVYELGTTTPSASNNITLQNETTGERMSTITNSQGRFIFDLANLPSGYTNGDFVRIQATGGVATGKILKFKMVTKVAQTQINSLDITYET